jgi:hypothetical protein
MLPVAQYLSRPLNVIPNPPHVLGTANRLARVRNLATYPQRHGTWRSTSAPKPQRACPALAELLSSVVHRPSSSVRRQRYNGRMASQAPLVVWTIGHSTHTLEDFIGLLQAHGVQTVADVRRFPGSRRYPHFNVAPLAAGLKTEGIDYLALPELGGRRTPQPDSVNTVWRNRSFQGYADYMETPEFAAGRERLLVAARRAPTAVMCAEAVWWRCHRALIADDLTARGVTVRHILSPAKTEVHPYTAAARLQAGRLSYASGEPARSPARPDKES